MYNRAHPKNTGILSLFSHIDPRNMVAEIKKLFFGLEVHSPWPEQLPQGRIIEKTDRHLTLAFLGPIVFSKIQEILPLLPLPPFQVGLVGSFDHCLFLPLKHPHVAAWHVHWLEPAEVLESYQKQLVKWLKSYQFSVNEYDQFLPHVTICRDPIHQSEWEQSFVSLPLIISHLHLYESLPHSKYKPIWSHHFLPPFEEVEHTADLAFLIYGENLNQLYCHAYIALAFKFPPLMGLFIPIEIEEGVNDIIMHLNEAISKADINIGCPFKAVSFHGEIEEENNILKWEMIIDV